MINIFKGLNGFNITKHSTYNDYINYITNYGFVMENLGLSSDNNLSIFGVKYGDFSKPTIFIVGNQHGDEWESAYYPIEFLKKIKDKDFLPKYHYLTNKYSFYIIPSANPYGFENLTYNNKNGINLNRNWDINWDTNGGEGLEPFSEPETKIIRDKILELKPIMVIDNHTWGHIPGEGSEYSALAISNTGLNECLIRYIQRTTSLITKTRISRYDYVDSPVLRHWASKQNSKNGEKIYGLVFEVGGAMSFEQQSKDGQNLYLSSLIYFDNYINQRKQQYYWL